MANGGLELAGPCAQRPSSATNDGWAQEFQRQWKLTAARAFLQEQGAIPLSLGNYSSAGCLELLDDVASRERLPRDPSLATLLRDDHEL